MKLLIFILSVIVGAAVSKRNCTKPGIHVSSDPRKFQVCAERDGKLLTTEHQCSKGLVFDITSKSCRVPTITSFFGQPFSNSSAIAILQRPENQTSVIAKQRAPLPCQSPGAMCDTCKTMSFCVGFTGVSRVRKILTLECETGSVCVTKLGCMLKSTGGLCRQGNFRCGDVGTYPDLYDCTKYHRCSTDATGRLVDEEIQCVGGLNGNRWSPENSQCGWSENVESCRKYPVPLCSKEFEIGSVGGQIYYICIVDRLKHTLSPTMFRCSANYVFDFINVSCIDIAPK